MNGVRVLAETGNKCMEKNNGIFLEGSSCPDWEQMDNLRLLRLKIGICFKSIACCPNWQYMELGFLQRLETNALRRAWYLSGGVILPRLTVTGGSPTFILPASMSVIFDILLITFCATSLAAAYKQTAEFFFAFHISFHCLTLISNRNVTRSDFPI